jgi:hypothetical protein
MIMAKDMSFSIGGRIFTAAPAKVDRGKLYGTTEKIALDDDGAVCQLVSMDESGTIIIPLKGAGIGILSGDGKWVERSQLKTVRLDESPAELIPSSYGIVNVLERKATPEELLDCAVKAFYHLSAAPELIAAIGGDIYAIDYCYRDSYETTPAFLLVSEQKLFMLTGTPNEFSFIALSELSVATDDEADDEEDGEIDFDSMF